MWPLAPKGLLWEKFSRLEGRILLGNQSDMFKTLGENSPENLRNLHRSRICFVTY